MTQVFVIGASAVYGVGAEEAGWGDLIKRHVHSKMYSNDGVGESYEVYNFSKSGATIDFIIDAYPTWIKNYYRSDKLVIVFSVGGNNSKAENEPDNYVSDPNDYSKEVQKLLAMFKKDSDNIISVSNAFVDESKTTPKANPLTGSRSFFTNQRMQLFNEVNKKLCLENGIIYKQLPVDDKEWLEKYIYVDGLHPNQAGHNLIFETIKVDLDKALQA